MEALYRKYRPRSFSEFLNQNQAKIVLQNAIEKGKISHAYIFTGPRGTGKTSLARIVAKSLNCPNRSGYEACNSCPSCKAIDKGTHMDVIELDAASNRGIDEIRKIRDAIVFRPLQGIHKVYIVDEFHMLTREAFNALLKTLEEPPENVTFILATTDLQKVPPTVVSRCQVIEFKNFSQNDISDLIRKVASLEHLRIDEKAVEILARRANGGMRDALAMLEQVVRFSHEKTVTSDTLQEALGLIPTGVVTDYLTALTSGRAKEAMDLIDRIYYEGKDIEGLIHSTLDHIEAKITENFSEELVELGDRLISLLRELRYAENKRVICKMISARIASLFVKESATVEDATEQLLVSQPQDEGSATHSSAMEQVITELKEKGDMSLFACLCQAVHVEKDSDVEIKFSPFQRFHYELVREKITELEYLLREKKGTQVRVTVTIDDDRTKRVIEKLKTLFPGKVITEE